MLFDRFMTDFDRCMTMFDTSMTVFDRSMTIIDRSMTVFDLFNFAGGGRSKLKNPTRRSELIQPASNGHSKEEAPEPAMPPPKQVLHYKIIVNWNQSLIN